jgi:hypothetical protein
MDVENPLPLFARVNDKVPELISCAEVLKASAVSVAEIEAAAKPRPVMSAMATATLRMVFGRMRLNFDSESF